MALARGLKIVNIDRFYPSTQICSGCGFQNKDETDSNKPTNKKKYVSFKDKEVLKIPTEHRNKMLTEN